jgi:MFS family permease
MSQKHDPSCSQPQAPSLSTPKPPSSLWRNRDFLFLWSGQMVSAIGSQVSLVAFPWLMLTLTRSPAQAGLLSAMRVLPYLLFGLPAGALVDRWDRKRVMIVCDLGRALALGSIPLALVFGKVTIVQLYLVSFVEGTLFLFFGAAEVACLPRVVSPEQLPAAAAQNEFVYSVSGLVGPSLSGLLYTLGNVLPFLADALSYTISVLSLFFIQTPFQEKRTLSTSKLRAEMREGVVWLWHHPVMRFLAVLIGGLNFASAGYLLIILVWAQTFHASGLTIGLIVTCGGIGSVVGAFLAGPLAKRFSFGTLLISATWMWALTWLLFAIPANMWVLGGAVLVAFLVVPLHASVQYTYRLTHIPDRLQGRVNSAIRLVLFGSQALGLLLTGALLQTYGPVRTVLLLFLPQLVLALITAAYPSLRKE